VKMKHAKCYRNASLGIGLTMIVLTLIAGAVTLISDTNEEKCLDHARVGYVSPYQVRTLHTKHSNVNALHMVILIENAVGIPMTDEITCCLVSGEFSPERTEFHRLNRSTDFCETLH